MIPLKRIFSTRPDNISSINRESLSHFLIFTFPTLFFFVICNYVLGFKAIALVELLVMLILPIAYALLQFEKNLVLVGHIVAASSCVLFSSLMFFETQADTGIYWICGYPFIVYFYVGLKYGTPWVCVYLLIICIELLLSYWQVVTLPYTFTELTFALMTLLFFSLLAYLYIRDRENNERQIRNNEQKFHRLYTHSLDAILLLDTETCLEHNQAARDIFSIPEGQAMPHLSRLALNGQYIHDILQQVSDKNTEIALECKRWDNSTFPAEMALAAVEIEGVRVTQVVIHDVSDRKLAEQEQQKYLYHLQCMDQLEIVLGQTLEIESALNQALQWMLRTFSCSRAWLLYPCDPSNETWSVPYEKTLPIHPSMLSLGQEMPMDENVCTVIHEVLNSREPICYGPNKLLPGQNTNLKDFDIRAQMVTGLYPETGKSWMLGMHECDYGRLWTEEEQRLFKDSATRIEATLNMLLLHQQLKDSEQALRQQTLQAEAANRAKSDFLSVMSHELRTPIHGVIGMLDLISENTDNLSKEQHQHLLLARKTAQALRSLVSDILDLSKAESGNIHLHPKKFDLNECLVTTLVSFVPQIRQKNMQLLLKTIQVPQFIIADQLRFRQIILNLVGNAVKFTEKGHVTVNLSYQQATSTLMLSVEDSGIGIHANYLDKIFDPFVQEADLLGSTKSQGTGLGTSIVKRFVELMGGEVFAKSTVGEGSCFSFYIQVEAVGARYISDNIDLSQEELREPKEKTSLFHPVFKNTVYKVLVAEDDPVTQLVMRKTLQKAGMQVEIAATGTKCWQLLQDNTYDLLLTDLRMPGMDGLQLTKKYRQFEKDKNRSPMLIIGLSAHALEDVIDACLAAGMHEFMTKPVRMRQVLSLINKHTEIK